MCAVCDVCAIEANVEHKFMTFRLRCHAKYLFPPRVLSSSPPSHLIHSIYCTRAHINSEANTRNKHYSSSWPSPNKCTSSSARCKIVGMPESINALELLVRRSSSRCSMLYALYTYIYASRLLSYLDSLPLATQPVKVSFVISSNKSTRHCTEPRSMNNLQQIANRKV